MKGDFSRNTYRPASQYSRVMMQQGRVQIDADWNEQTSILLGYMRALTRDLFGDHAGPAADCGFKIVSSENLSSLSKEEAAIAKAILERDKKDLDDKDLLILPGRYYVGGIPVDAGGGLRYSGQTGAAPIETLKGKAFLAYLDVWEEFISADQDDHIRDVALGGVDTCGRARVMWQVRLAFDPPAKTPLDALPSRKPGLVRVIANPDEAQDDLCSIAPDARYRGVENQLYRIEIQSGGGGDGAGKGKVATFKWSRDNGSVTYPVVASDGLKLTVAHLGRDEATGLVIGDWVELVDDAMIAATGVGQMAQVADIDTHDFRVELVLPDGASPLPSYKEAEASAAHALLRRWDQKGATLAKTGGAIPAESGKLIELEDGIMAEFKGEEYVAGDYWFIPARVLTGDVEWDADPGADGFRAPDGPHHAYAPLALTSAKGGLDDLRCQIERLKCVEAKRGTAQPATGTVPVLDTKPVVDTKPVAGVPADRVVAAPTKGKDG